MASEAAEVARRMADAKTRGILDLSRCGLMQVPPSVYTFLEGVKISKIDLSRNQLKSIPGQLMLACPQVQDLNISYNSLMHLPDEIRSLQNLQKLNLSCNGFTELPWCVYSLTKLKELRVQDNGLEVIDVEQFKFLSNLERLDLEENPIDPDIAADIQLEMGDDLVITI